jgi:hypothetical protein
MSGFYILAVASEQNGHLEMIKKRHKQIHSTNYYQETRTFL